MEQVAAQLVHADDAEYRRDAAAEAAFWAEPPPYSAECLERAFADGPVERYVNRRFTGHPDLGWCETIARHGPFRRGIVLGTDALTAEARILETNPGLHLTFVDISPGALTRRAEQLGTRFPGHVDTRTADLNFIELPRSAYDVVISSAAFHHVTNLEWLADQIGRTLRPGGTFFLHDYVGERRFQFSDSKKRAFEAFHDDFLRRRLPGRRPGVRWRDDSDLSPFCGVRSDDVLPALAARLQAVTVRTASAMIVPLARSSPVDESPPPPPRLLWRAAVALDDWQRRWRRQLPRLRQNLPAGFLRELLRLDETACDAGVLLPGIAFGVYRPR